jgi:L-threonylcarbamoyladenylate synthase
VRVPDHPATLRLLSALHKRGSVGVAAPSANRFGSISPTTAAHVLSDLTGRVDAILDGGPCRVGVESTIVDCTKEPAAILRHGGISVENISACLIEHGLAVMASDDEVGTVDTEKAIAPGMLRSHYAPRTKLLVFSTHAEVEAARRGAEARGKKVAVLPHDDDSYEYSRNLYSSLRRCDDEHADIIVALLPRPTGLGAAVRDRLLKAAAER